MGLLSSQLMQWYPLPWFVSERMESSQQLCRSRLLTPGAALKQAEQLWVMGSVLQAWLERAGCVTETPEVLEVDAA